MKLMTLRNNHAATLPLPQAGPRTKSAALPDASGRAVTSVLSIALPPQSLMSGKAHAASRRDEMPARFGEMKARSMRDATEMHPRWKRDGSEIWRDAGLYKFSQISRNLSKSQETWLSGGFRRFATTPKLFHCVRYPKWWNGSRCEP